MTFQPELFRMLALGLLVFFGLLLVYWSSWKDEIRRDLASPPLFRPLLGLLLREPEMLVFGAGMAAASFLPMIALYVLFATEMGNAVFSLIMGTVSPAAVPMAAAYAFLLPPDIPLAVRGLGILFGTLALSVFLLTLFKMCLVRTAMALLAGRPANPVLTLLRSLAGYPSMLPSLLTLAPAAVFVPYLMADGAEQLDAMERSEDLVSALCPGAGGGDVLSPLPGARLAKWALLGFFFVWPGSFAVVFSTPLMEGVAGVMFGLFGLPMLWALSFAGIASVFNTVFLALVLPREAAGGAAALSPEYLARPFETSRLNVRR